MTKKKSSYRLNNFDLVFRSVCFSLDPKLVVEVGILNGFSLECIADSVSSNCEILAYDLFDNQPEGSHPSYPKYIDVKNKFKKYDNIKIEKSDFLNVPFFLKNKSVDICHIDVHNDGEVYEYSIKKYLPKLRSGGILILEGGSEDRDNVEWMRSLNRRPINSYLKSLENNYNIILLDKWPSMTIIRN